MLPWAWWCGRALPCLLAGAQIAILLAKMQLAQGDEAVTSDLQMKIDVLRRREASALKDAEDVFEENTRHAISKLQARRERAIRRLERQTFVLTSSLPLPKVRCAVRRAFARRLRLTIGVC